MCLSCFTNQPDRERSVDMAPPASLDGNVRTLELEISVTRAVASVSTSVVRRDRMPALDRANVAGHTALPRRSPSLAAPGALI